MEGERESERGEGDFQALKTGMKVRVLVRTLKKLFPLASGQRKKRKRTDLSGRAGLPPSLNY